VDAVRPADAPLEELLEALHPTPAVCGQPREAARRWIREAEPAPRGWYAGAVGWVGLDAARFAVGIRSAAVHGHTALVYAGAGLVPGSTAEGEWAETERKAAPLVTLLTGGAP
jgi:menaquinone-specific isochorismate synthase